MKLISNVSVVICARNERENLPVCLDALFSQSVKPYEVVLVDDGSIDDTSHIGLDHGCRVFRLPFHSESFVGRPELAVRFNCALSKVSSKSDYVLVVGADSVLPNNYIEYLLDRMHEDSCLKAVSGWVKEESFDAIQPRGSGRLIDAKWWRSLNGLKFPVAFGWEAWLQYKVMSLGFKAKSYKDLHFTVLRKTGISLKQTECHGCSMNSLGYFWPFALARCISRGPKYGSRMFIGWIKGRRLAKLDVADYVCALQNKRLVAKSLDFLKEML